MGDSQNWSSFDAEAPKPTKPTPPVRSESTQNASNNTVLGFRPGDLRNLRNRLVFGGLVGFCTGATFGTIDSIRAYQKTHPRLSLDALNPVARGAAVSGGAFAGFFLAYQGVKAVMEVQRGQDDLVNLGVATVVGGAPFLWSKVLRHNIPYALMLVALDHFHEDINEARR